tara:strand:- start:1118 stop:1957 length:840 start_codon:yes stop_codon:yes gene_type:complete
MATTYTFPQDLGTSKQLHFMKFNAYIIKGNLGSAMEDFQFGSPVNGSPTIALPIPTGLNTTYAQNWGTEEVGLVGSAAGNTLRGAMEGSGFFDTIGGAFGGAYKTVTSASWAEIGSKVLGVTGSPIQQRATGRATFANVVATYGGPAFREFQFQFSMKPLSVEEMGIIEKIVQFFKRYSAPGNGLGELWRTYQIPHAFGISFHHGDLGTENVHLPKIQKCVLTNISVTYGGDKFNTFAGTDGAPVQTDLSLSFQEIVLLDKTAFGADKDEAVGRPSSVT